MQNLIFIALLEIYPDAIQNYRPDWLKNPKTNHNLELDIYIPSINLGYELQGIHHRLDKYAYNDNLKKELASKHETKIVYFEKRKDIVKYLENLGVSNKKLLRKILKYKMSRHMFKTYGVQYARDLYKQRTQARYLRYKILQEQETESIKQRRANGSRL